MRRLERAGWSALLIFAVSACNSTNGGNVTLEVAAAASLGTVFQQLGTEFKTTHPDIDLEFNFASSSELAYQITEGAPVDVFASADVDNMTRVEGTGRLVEPSAVFATNYLEIIVEKGNPLEVRSINDLNQPNLLFITASPEVPIGKYAAQVLDNAGVDIAPVSYEKDVSMILTKVRIGAADAGIVYHSTVVAANGLVDSVPIADELNVVARYPIGIIDTSKDTASAQLFVDFVLSERGREILKEQGFSTP